MIEQSGSVFASVSVPHSVRIGEIGVSFAYLILREIRFMEIGGTEPIFGSIALEVIIADAASRIEIRKITLFRSNTDR